MALHWIETHSTEGSVRHWILDHENVGHYRKFSAYITNERGCWQYECFVSEGDTRERCGTTRDFEEAKKICVKALKNKVRETSNAVKKMEVFLGMDTCPGPDILVDKDWIITKGDLRGDTCWLYRPGFAKLSHSEVFEAHILRKTDSPDFYEVTVSMAGKQVYRGGFGNLEQAKSRCKKLLTDAASSAYEDIGALLKHLRK